MWTIALDNNDKCYVDITSITADNTEISISLVEITVNYIER